MQSFVETWPQEVWPIIQKKYEELLEKRPAKQTDATGGHYGQRVYEFLQTKGGEVRNITCNLAYLGPVRNTFLQQDISVETVERFALDLYVDTSPALLQCPSTTRRGTRRRTRAGRQTRARLWQKLCLPRRRKPGKSRARCHVASKFL